MSPCGHRHLSDDRACVDGGPAGTIPRWREVAAVSAVALLLTLVIAAPALRAPSERIFGMEIVGRHHDPFTMMAQFGGPVVLGVYAQPVTDIAGALLARVTGPVAAYNWLVLISFPLAAAAAYVLARHLGLAPAGASVAALGYAFAPFHLAHAAYHPHIAQTQWIPLYLLALWRCLDRASPAAVAWLGAASVAVALSNFYGGLIVAVVTPVAVLAYWWSSGRLRTGSVRRLGITVGSLVLIAACGMAYAWYAAGAVVTHRAGFAFPRDDLFRYSAKWWSYLVPPVGHPWLGEAARQLWNTAGVREGLLEQQVALGWGIVALGVVAFGGWLVQDKAPASLPRVPVLIVVAATALVCSLSPERTIGSFTFVRPSALLYDSMPMFRCYARFGVVVQLMAVLLAGIGADVLLRVRTRRAQIVCGALLAIAAGEYVVWPGAMWRDVLPTAAHRWVVQQPGRIRALDCEPLTPESSSVEWLTGGRVSLLTDAVGDCLEPDVPQKLAAIGFSHLLVRNGTRDGRWFASRPVPDGLVRKVQLAGGDVFTVTAVSLPVYTVDMRGFFDREHNEEWTWRWMGPAGSWTIVNTSGQPVTAALDIEMGAFDVPRRLDLLLDRRLVQTLGVDPPRRTYRIGPLTLSPGKHELVLHPAAAATVADAVLHNGDGRPLTFAVGRWRWTIEGRP